MEYKGHTYNVDVRYFGAQNHWTTKLFDPFPPGIPQLRNLFNEVSFRHDVDYIGTKRSGWFGRFRDFIDRKYADKRFQDDLLDGIMAEWQAKIVTDEEMDEADDFVEIAHSLIRSVGFTFYKTGDTK